MATTKYSYNSNQFLNGKVYIDGLIVEIREALGISIAVDYVDYANGVCDVYFKAALPGSEWTTLSGIVAIHTGEMVVVDEPRDRGGKMKVSASPRMPDVTTYFTSKGDNPSNPRDVGGGERITIAHSIGESTTQSVYFDLNIVENQTFVREGFIIWKDAVLDSVTIDVVPRVTPTTASSGTNYNLYGGYLVVQAYPGTGNIQILSDITTHSGGLIYMPSSESGKSGVGYWNASWNTTTKKYENISAAPAGDGRYNMFAVEVTLARFVNEITLIGNGFELMRSDDVDELGHGMRFKAIMKTYGADHYWSMAGIFVFHRNRTV